MQFQSLCPILPSKDLDETRAFYEAIGFEAVGVFPDYGYLILQRDTAELHFFTHAELDVAENYAAGYLRLPDVDPLSDHLATLGIPEGDKGIPRWSPAHDTPWGMRETVWIDPNGNLIRAGAFLSDD